MQKKGFTLIELLAVIVILSIIALISSPIILNVIKDARYKSYLATKNNIKRAAELYLMVYIDKIPQGEGKKVVLTLSEIIEAGFSKNTVNPLTGRIIEPNKVVIVEAINKELVYNVLIEDEIINFDVGRHHVIASGYYNEIYGWGYNEYHLISSSSELYNYIPTPIDSNEAIFGGESIIDVATCYKHILVLTESGNVYTWGKNDYGQLGVGDIIDRDTPQNITLHFGSDKIIDVDCGGEDASLARTDTGDIYLWGDNNYGQLGDSLWDEHAAITVPVKVTKDPTNEFYNLKIRDIALGYMFTVVITEDDKVYTIGSNSHGELGIGLIGDDYCTLELVDITSNFNGKPIAVKATNKSVILLTENSKIYTWGANEYGQLGNGTYDVDQATPTQIWDGREGIRKVNMGYDIGCFITKNGDLYLWGNNSNGQLGINSIDSEPRTSPINVSQFVAPNGQPNFNGEKIKKVELGYRNVVVLTYDNKMYTIGYGDYGIIGDGGEEDKILPYDMTINY